MFGKIVDGRLEIAGNTIKTENGFITNPNAELLRSLGYKEVQYTEKPEFDKENEKLIEIYNEINISEQIQDGITRIVVNYEKVSLTPAEHNAVIKQEIVEEEKKMTDRNIRGALLNNSYDINEITKIEDNIATLRAKLVEEPKEEDNGNID